MAAAPVPAPSRRAELLRIAADLFAERGYKTTTVRDIADAAGILSGSLYHHFDSKESMVDEILSTFQAGLFAEYDAVIASEDDVRTKLERLVHISFAAIDRDRPAVAIFQNDAGALAADDRFAYLRENNERFQTMWSDLINEGIRTGALRDDLDPVLTYRFIRDTVWVAVGWYRPGGPLGATEVAEQYLAILLDGLGARAS
ncbi:MAG: TetR/AcrR family transcriptional regulator [Nocardioides sp.]|nr:TetR/AcrR family transcriptional regulator [Nocardioides sp.]